MLGLLAGLAGAAVGTAIKGGYDAIKSNRDDSIAKQRAERQAALDYEYAEKYAKNSPSWNMEGMKAAGINPILAVGNGYSSSSWHPSSPSNYNSGDSGIKISDFADLQNKFAQNELLENQAEVAETENDIKNAELDLLIKENEVKGLKAEAEASLLRDVPAAEALEGDGKSVQVFKHSDTFKAYQKMIKDNYDLGSERYVRETADAVAKYGLEALALLPTGRRREVIHVLKGVKSRADTFQKNSPRTPVPQSSGRRRSSRR